MKIYIAGPMSRIGPPTWNFPAFDEAQDRLEAEGHLVISPAELDRMYEGWRYFPPEGFRPTRQHKAEMMRRDLQAIEGCDAIYLLKGWDDDSKGANVEKAYAEFLGLEILYEEEVA